MGIAPVFTARRTARFDRCNRSATSPVARRRSISIPSLSATPPPYVAAATAGRERRAGRVAAETPSAGATLDAMRILHETRATIAAHWRERHGNMWGWMLPLAVLACAIPPR